MNRDAYAAGVVPHAALRAHISGVSKLLANTLESDMATYITIEINGDIGCAVYPTNTDEEIAAARAALRDAELDYADEYAGEPDGSGDSYKNGNKLFAK